MIEWIEFKNFKALRNTRLPLSRFTLIVGPNGSGKSSALHAVLALSNQINFKSMRSAGVAETEPVVSTAKWGEVKNEILIKVQWDRGSRSGPLFEPGGQTQRRDDNKPMVALNRARIFSLDPGAIAQPVVLHPKAELAPTGAKLAGVLDRLRDQ